MLDTSLKMLDTPFVSHRNAQIAGIIRSVVAAHALQIPPTVATVVSIVDVRVSSDYSYADLSVSALDHPEAAIEFLYNRKGAMRHEIAAKLRMHRIPLLRFHIDVVGAQGTRMDELLRTIEGKITAQNSQKKRKFSKK